MSYGILLIMAKHKILIIEDEPVHLNVIKSKLEFEGYNVVTAMDGEEGFNLIKSEKPSLVLLDIILPKMNGFEVLEHLQKEGISVPVIVVSNSGQPVEVDKALKMGVRDYLVKAEFNPADVLEKVEGVLGKASSRGERQAPPSATTASAVSELAAGASQRENVKTAAGNKILTIEDDKFLRDLISQKLQREGFVALEAIDGEAGLKIAEEKHPDLILLDLILPSLDGFEVLRQLKAKTETAKIPVIVLSNLGQKEDMERAMSGGAEEFMIKAHFTPGEIIAKIKEILKKKY